MLERQLGDVAAGVARSSGDDRDSARIPPAITRKIDVGDADERGRDADRQQQRLQARAGEVDLLAGGRRLAVERAHSGDVDRGGHERHAEHEEADGACDEGRCGCSCGRDCGPWRRRRLQLDVDDHRAEEQRRGRRGRTGRAAALRRSARRRSRTAPPMKRPPSTSERDEVDRAEAARAERQLRDRVEQDGVEEDLPARLGLAAHDRQHRHADRWRTRPSSAATAPRSAAASRRRRSRTGRAPCP